MADPLISVIIPTYNCSTYIVETIESVLSQTYINYEIIVIDDGSTDNTRDLIDKYVRQNKVQYIYKENGGVSSARNVGIKNARGKYVALFDADDLWYPEKLEKQVQVMEENPEFGMVHTDSSVIDEYGNLMVFSANKGRQSRNGMVFAEFFMSYYSLVVLSAAMIRKDCFAEIGGFDKNIKVSQDAEFFLHLFWRYPVYLIDEPLVKRRLVPGSLISNTIKNIVNCENALNDFINNNKDYFLKHKIDLAQKWDDFNYQSAFRLWHAREYLYSNKYFRKVLLYKLKIWPYYFLTLLPGKFLDKILHVKKCIIKFIRREHK